MRTLLFLAFMAGFATLGYVFAPRLIEDNYRPTEESGQAAPVARDAIRWAIRHGLDPHVNHLERFIIAASDPKAEDYSAFLGARAELVDDLAAAIDHPVSKILAVGEQIGRAHV